MTADNSAYAYYKLGGSLEYQHPTYIVRQADHILYRSLKAGEFCYVLNSRQMGKSSLRVQMMKRLREEGVQCAAIDMMRMGSHVTETEWYGGIVSELIRVLSLSQTVDFSSWWSQRELLSPIQRLSVFIEDVLLIEFPQGIVIFIDEIDSILKFSFKNDFFAFIRSCYDKRAENSEYQRLSFVFLGVATPSDLIADRNRTPFNIGRAIALEGFQWHEAEPLLPGLQAKADDPQAVLQAILSWTGGQPFLTQKLCSLVSTLDGFIAAGQEAEQVEAVVRSRILNNWDSQDEPEHLRTIRDRLLGEETERSIQLLTLYRQISLNGSIPQDGSTIQTLLRLSGIAVKQEGTLQPYNRIYQTIFDLAWVEQQLRQINPPINPQPRPQSTTPTKGQSLQRSQSQPHSRNSLARSPTFHRWQTRLFLSLLLMVVVGGGWRVRRWIGAPSTRPQSSQPSPTQLDPALRARFSLGDRILTPGGISPIEQAGVNAFANADYDRAAALLETYFNHQTPSDPEALIYLNNARIGNQAAYTIAVSVPLQGFVNRGREILRGVAQAQYEINQQGGIHQQVPLKVLIVNDDGNPEIAKQIAMTLVSAPDLAVLGVIGHFRSNSTEAAAPIYERGGLVLISPTSTANSISQLGDYIFRTVPSDYYTASSLANYMQTHLQRANAAVCYNSVDGYSTSLLKEFTSALEAVGGTVVERFDVASPNFDARSIGVQAQQKGAQVLVLLVGSDRLNDALAVVQENQQTLPILAGDSLYSPELLKLQANATAVVIAVPWFLQLDSPNSTVQDFIQTSRALWKGDVNWRTAMAYDAVQVLIAGLEQEPSRAGIQQTLSEIGFVVEGATGTIVFTQEGDRNQTMQPVGIQPSSVNSSNYTFVPLH